MLKSVRSLTAATLLVGTACAAAPALAQDIGSELSVSGNVAVVTDYRFRGVSQSGGDFALQGGIDVAHDSGFYVGTWGSSIEGGATLGELELDIYAGWSGEISPGVVFDVGLLYYMYPTVDGGGDTDFFEPYASIGTTLGPVGATVGVAYAWEQDALGGNDNLYVYTDWTLGVPNTPISLSAHLGYTDGVLAPKLLAAPLLGDDEGFDWSIGASMPLTSGLTLGVAYVGSEGPSIDGFTDDAVVGTLTFAM